MITSSHYQNEALKVQYEVHTCDQKYPQFRTDDHPQRKLVSGMMSVEYPWKSPNYCISNAENTVPFVPDCRDKYTVSCRRCLAVVLLGKSAESCAEVSTLMHVAPPSVRSWRRGFINAARQAIGIFREHTTDSSRFSLIAGGYYPLQCWIDGFRHEYRRMIRMTRTMIEDELSLPITIVQPKFIGGDTDVYCHTSGRRIDVVQDNPESAAELQPFPASILRKESSSWRKLQTKI